MPQKGRIQRWAAHLLVVCLLANLAACATGTAGSGGARVSGGDLDAGKRLVDLTQAERAALCDWSAAQVGGYGTRFYCPGFVYQTYATQAACVESRSRVAPTCAATVADSRACTTVTQDDPCRATARDGAPECAGPLKGCFPSPAAARTK